ncbi:MAG: adenylyl-sulfate kinase, partial [Betaproteobacteria bacterium]|nr:adenylyl-sulfate kinase [Betaproteobacteria bacterium]
LIRCLLNAAKLASPARDFFVDDLPGHDHDTPKYARDLIAAASIADVAIVVVDAIRGFDAQARRHSHIASLLGTPRIVVAVNKLDLVAYAQDVFERIALQFQEFARAVGMQGIACVPTCALTGDNVTAPSHHMPWYRGPTLRDCLDAVGAATEAPRSTPIVSVDDAGVSAGGGPDATQSHPSTADQFEATIFWTSDDAMLPGRAYLLKGAEGEAAATLAAPKYRLDLETLEHLPARTLRLDDVGVCNLHLDRAIAFDPFKAHRDSGRFVLADRFTGESIGAGMLHFALRRSQNIHWQAIEVDKAAHRALKGHRSCVVWFTGLSGAGKSTIANLVEKNLHASGLHTYLLDGDNIRHGLNKDLGFTQADRVENIRRIAEVARLMADAGLIVLVSFISPFRAERRFARGLLGAGEFCEVFVDAPLHVAEARDRKGLYRKARSGELLNFTGIDSPYEPPEHPDVAIDTTSCSPEAAAERVVARLREMGVFGQARSRGA